MEVTWGFCLAASWFNYLDGQGLFPLALAACAIHELGHYAVIRCFGGNIKLLRLTAIGAEMRLDRPLSYVGEGVAALAGPGCNLLLALILCRWPQWLVLSGLNLVLGCFNLLPVSVMDGGRAMACTLALLAGPGVAEAVGRTMDRAFTAAMLLCGLLLLGARGNITMLVVALWLTALLVRDGGRKNS